MYYTSQYFNATRLRYN